MRCGQRFGEKAFGCLSISSCTQEEVQRMAGRIHSPIQVHPHLFHFHIRFVNSPGISRDFEMGSTAFLQFGCVVLHESGRSWCDRRAIRARALSPQISIAEWITQVPAHAEQNKLGLEMTPFDWGGGFHEIGSSQFSEYRRVYRILVIFTTEPFRGTLLTSFMLPGRPKLGANGCGSFTVGLMFWLSEKKLVGSYLFLSATNRS